jgi:hypothetical protein
MNWASIYLNINDFSPSYLQNGAEQLTCLSKNFISGLPRLHSSLKYHLFHFCNYILMPLCVPLLIFITSSALSIPVPFSRLSGLSQHFALHQLFDSEFQSYCPALETAFLEDIMLC